MSFQGIERRPSGKKEAVEHGSFVMTVPKRVSSHLWQVNHLEHFSSHDSFK